MTTPTRPKSGETAAEDIRNALQVSATTRHALLDTDADVRAALDDIDRLLKQALGKIETAPFTGEALTLIADQANDRKRRDAEPAGSECPCLSGEPDKCPEHGQPKPYVHPADCDHPRCQLPF